MDLLAKTILLSNDDPETLRILDDILTGAGFRNVHVALTANETIELGELVVPNLIITNLATPQMIGQEMARLIKAKSALARIPILLLSCFEKEHARDQIAAFVGHLDQKTR